MRIHIPSVVPVKFMTDSKAPSIFHQILVLPLMLTISFTLYKFP